MISLMKCHSEDVYLQASEVSQEPFLAKRITEPVLNSPHIFMLEALPEEEAEFFKTEDKTV